MALVKLSYFHLDMKLCIYAPHSIKTTFLSIASSTLIVNFITYSPIRTKQMTTFLLWSADLLFNSSLPFCFLCACLYLGHSLPLDVMTQSGEIQRHWPTVLLILYFPQVLKDHIFANNFPSMILSSFVKLLSSSFNELLDNPTKFPSVIALGSVDITSLLMLFWLFYRSPPIHLEN